jgi:hypothetical protein
MIENTPILEEKKLEELYSLGLQIPDYQRPYKWKKEHVIQLLNDLYHNVIQKKDSVYRVGSIILHKENIVDGQQRLTTLSLVLHYLGNSKCLLQNQNYDNEISKNNIKFNYQVIKEWFAGKSVDNLKFQEKIEKYCEFVVITVHKQDEAFQLFDSQNSRGKALYPHDLLKAFHLREMDKNGNTQQEMETYSSKWESYLLKDSKPLLDIMNNHLFRIRKWSKRERKYLFSKHDINEFKGISLYKPSKYNYETSLRILDGTVENAQKNNLFKNFSVAQSFPFQITMPIINGKNFFDYIFFYIEIKEEVFGNEKTDFVKFNNDKLKYDGIHRVGDQKVKNLYENICLFFIDRFGIENFEKVYYEEFFKNAFQLRLDSGAISENSILKYDKGMRFFNLIPTCYEPENLQPNLFCNYNQIPKKPNIELEAFITIKKN